MKLRSKYIAFLRGINVGGHKKVPMAELKTELQKAGYKNIITILNSGNIIFDTEQESVESLEKTISALIESHFGFPVPTIVRSADEITELYNTAPFKGIEVTKETRLYISFLKEDTSPGINLPWSSDDGSYKILTKQGKNIVSVLDLAISGTPEAMEIMEKTYGKGITTRNWNTIERIMKKIDG